MTQDEAVELRIVGGGLGADPIEVRGVGGHQAVETDGVEGQVGVVQWSLLGNPAWCV